MKDCSVQLTNMPGDLARVAEALPRRGVNIKALGAMSVDGMAIVHILPDDIVVARSARYFVLGAVARALVRTIVRRAPVRSVSTRDPDRLSV